MRAAPTPDWPDDRAMLRAAVENLAEAVARGHIPVPPLAELEGLALICKDKGLPVEAARVRSWVAAGRVLRICDVGRLIPG